MESIGDFAEKLILSNIEESKDSPSARSQLLSTATPDPHQLDISKVEVPSNFMEQVLNEGSVTARKRPDTAVVKRVEQVKTKHLIKESEEEDLDTLVAKFNALLIEAKGVLGQLREMTTVGMGGMGPGGGCGFKHVHEPRRRRRRRRK